MRLVKHLHPKQRRGACKLNVRIILPKPHYCWKTYTRTAVKLNFQSCQMSLFSFEDLLPPCKRTYSSASDLQPQLPLCSCTCWSTCSLFSHPPAIGKQSSALIRDVHPNQQLHQLQQQTLPLLFAHVLDSNLLTLLRPPPPRVSLLVNFI